MAKKTILRGLTLVGIGTLFLLWYGDEVKHWFDISSYWRAVVMVAFLILIAVARNKLPDDKE